MKRNRWNKEEEQILYDNCYENTDTTYADLEKLIPNKTRLQIQEKCGRLKLNKFIRHHKSQWVHEEKELLRQLYPIKSKYELIEIFIDKEWNSIYATAVSLGLKKDEETAYKSKINNLKRTPNAWNEEKNEKMIELFNTGGKNEVLRYFQDIHTKNYLIKIMKENKLIELSEKDKISKNITKINNNNNRVFTINTADCFKLYKKILDGSISNFNKTTLSKHQLILMFKYYLKSKNIKITREQWINDIALGKIIKSAKIANQVKVIYHSYYDFICECFPSYGFKEWEFKHSGVTNGFWDNKFNRYDCIRCGIINMLSDNVINAPVQILGLEHSQLRKYINKTLISVYGKNTIIDYLKFIGVAIDEYVVKMYDDILFDSIEEKEVYKYILNYNVVINKNKKKFYNKKYDENYIPDFIINKINNITLKKPIIIEYFGLYRKNNSYLFTDYNNKTIRKIEYYKSLDNICFIDLYPEDLKDNFKGVSEKLTSFLLCNK